MEKKAMDFLTMDFSAQESIINACLVNSAKLINSLQAVNMDKSNDGTTYSATKSYRDCVKFLFAEHDDVFNTAWIICTENASNEKYSDMPLALFVSKASGKALRKAFYWNAKNTSECVDTETMVNCADSIESYQVIFDMDRIESILKNVRNEIKDNCAKVIDMLILGYNYNEIAQAMDMNIKSIYKYASAIVNAIAIVNAMDKEWNALDSIIGQAISEKDKASRMALEETIYNAYKAYYPKAEKADIKTMIDRLKAQAYYNNTQASLASAFYNK